MISRRQLEKSLKKLTKSAINSYKVSKRKKDWLKFVRSHINNRTLTENEKNAVLSFYKPYCKVNTIFFDYYKEKTGRFDVRFIPDDIYFGYIDPFYNDWEMAKIFDNKCYYPKLFEEAEQPETLLIRMNGFWLDKDYHQLSDLSVKEIISNEPAFFVKKAVESDGGHGVYYIDGQSVYEKFTKTVNSINCDLIVQKPIIQHEFLAGFNSSSVNTIRVLSLLNEKEVKIYSTALRIGGAGKKVDNASSGGYTCGIDENGNVRMIAHNKQGESFSSMDLWPQLKNSTRIPGIEDVWKAVRVLHVHIPHFRLVSWDFSIGKNGKPILVEANLCYGGIEINQLNNGPVFGNDTEKILIEVFGGRKTGK